jgi:hypothetical protein
VHYRFLHPPQLRAVANRNCTRQPAAPGNNFSIDAVGAVLPLAPEVQAFLFCYRPRAEYRQVEHLESRGDQRPAVIGLAAGDAVGGDGGLLQSGGRETVDAIAVLGAFADGANARV